MRKFNKKKGSRQGAILVTVVFILAFAMIFIAAAMMLTQATRKRVYSEAESSQARLTVTSVSEAFLRAMEKCEFSDDALIDLFKGPNTIRVQASSTAGQIPGLEDYGHHSDDSYTSVYLHRSLKTGETDATNNNNFTYYAEFSTHIGDEVENVRATFSYTKPKYQKSGAPFGTQVDFNGEFGNNNLNVVGEGKENDPDNVFLVRKGGKNTDSGFSSYSTLVYCDGAVAFKDDEHKSKDVVFLSGAYLKNLSDSSNPKGALENLFFIGNEGEITDIADSADNGNFKGDSPRKLNFYLYNRKDTHGTWTQEAKGVYELNSNGEVINTLKGAAHGEVSDAFKLKVQKYIHYNTLYSKKANDNKSTFPTTEEFLASAEAKLNIGKTHPSGSKTMSLGKFLTDYNYKKIKDHDTYHGYVPSGDYYFDKDESDATENHGTGFADKEPYIMVLNGSHDYRFWFGAGKDFTMYNIIFIVANPNPNHPALFLLENGAKVYWPGGGNKSNGKFLGNGILSVESKTYGDRTFANAKAAYDYVHDKVTSNSGPTTQTFENSNNKYSRNYDASNESCAMIIGMNNNHLQTDQNVVLECFIGLFNYASGGGHSNVTFRNNNSNILYGRLMTDGMGFQENGGTDSGSITMPASPGATTLPAPDPIYQKAKTGFSLKSMVYYYGLTGAPE